MKVMIVELQDQDEEIIVKGKKKQFRGLIPKIVVDYAFFMRGIDKLSRLSAYYRSPHRQIR